MSNYSYNTTTYGSLYNSDPYGTQQSDSYGSQQSDPYGAQQSDPYASQPSDSYGSQPYSSQPYGDSYGTSRFSGGSLLQGNIDGKPMGMSRPPVTYNHSRAPAPARLAPVPARGARTVTAARAPMVLQEDMDQDDTGEAEGYSSFDSSYNRPTPAYGGGSPLMSHSTTRTVVKRPAAGASPLSKFSRGMSGGRGQTYGQSFGSARGGLGSGRSDSYSSYSSSTRGSSFGSRGSRGSTFGAGRGAKSITRSGPKSVAGSHPAQGVVVSFPDHTYEVVAYNKSQGILNRYLVALKLGPANDNRIFVGAGMNEKVAKHEASYNALKTLFVLGHDKMLDHVTDAIRDDMTEIRKMRTTAIPKMTLKGAEVDVVQYVNSVYAPDVKFAEPEILSKGKMSLFKATLTVRGHIFVEVGLTMKKAKDLAALTCIKSFEHTPPPGMGHDDDEVQEQGIPETFLDKLVALVYETMNESTKNVSKEYLRPRNVAGIIIQHGNEDKIEKCQVIAVASGANTIVERMLKEDGTAVHDCNAEMLAIRAFRTYLYDQLDKAIDRKASILQKVKENVFKLKPGYKVIMAKNNPPAGDAMVVPNAATFKARERFMFNAQLDTPGAMQFMNISKFTSNSKLRGNGVSQQKFNTDAFLTEKNIKKHFVACPSDKLTVRNIAGIQGALLSQFLQPIYIEKYLFHNSITVSPEALKRSFYERVEAQIYKVPPPYKIFKPEFQTYYMKVVTGKPFDKYAGWMTCKPERDWEVIKVPEGASITEMSLVEPIRHKCESDVEYYEKKLENAKKLAGSMRPSQLSKRSLFEQYKWVSQKLNREIPDTYFACKALANEYHAIKLSVNNAFNKANLGTWPTKEINTENFTL